MVVMSIQRRRHTGIVAGRTWTAEDDGGLDYFPPGQGMRVCHIEAKNRLTVIREGRPIPSDSLMAQMTAEALAIYTSTNMQECVFTIFFFFFWL